MVKKVIIGFLGVFCAVFLALGMSAEAFADYACKPTMVGSSEGGSPGGSSGGGETVTPTTPSPIADVNEGSCTSILPGSWCNGEGGITSIISLVVSILTGTILVAGTIGIIFCGFTWMTARENEAQVAKAKKRMLEIVIGLVAWVLLALLANLFIPKPADEINISEVLQRQSLMTEQVTLTAGGRDGYCSMKAPVNQVLTPATADSVDVACADGTKDLGIDDRAYINGNRISIRLCSIPNIKQGSGYIKVSSRVSGAFLSLGEKYAETHSGALLSASQSFRTYAEQEHFYKCWEYAKAHNYQCSSSCNTCNNAAAPGYSNHQSGLAVDFDMGGSGWGSSGVSGFFNEYLSYYGLKRPLTVSAVGEDKAEPWHVVPK